MIFDTYQRMRVYGTSWAGTSHTYSKGWVDFVLVILHFFGDLAIFLLFCNHQNTKSESRDMEIGVSGPIFTHKNIKGSLVQWNTYKKNWKKILWQFFIFMELDPFFYDYTKPRHQIWFIWNINWCIWTNIHTEMIKDSMG